MVQALKAKINHTSEANLTKMQTITGQIEVIEKVMVEQRKGYDEMIKEKKASLNEYQDKIALFIAHELKDRND